MRHAWRSIRRMPLLACVVIGSLGIGIGVNTTIFSWIQALVLSPLPGVRDAASLRLLEARREDGTYPGMAWAELRDLDEALPSFLGLLAFRMAPLTLGEPGRVDRVFGMLVSGNYFSLLGLTPQEGRFFRPEEAATPGGAAVAVVSHVFWRNRLAGAPGVVGHTIRLNDRDVTIIGVAPEGFQGTITGLDFDLWVPATLAPVLFEGTAELTDRRSRGYAVMGRLAPGATSTRGQDELDRAMQRLAFRFPAVNTGLGGELLPIFSPPRGPQRFMVSSLVLLQGIMFLLLLAVCGNTANLVLARASARRREVGVRIALGSGPWRIARLLLAEALLLGLLGAALGAALAVWGSRALRALPLIAAFPIRYQTGVDLTGLGFAVLLGALCGVVFGTGPAWQLARLEPQQALRETAGATSRGGLRTLLMGAEVALAMVVLVAAAYFLSGMRNARTTDPGFRREGVLLAAYDLSGRPSDSAAVRVFTARLLERLAALRGVEAAAIAAAVPLDIHGLPSRGFELEGRGRVDAAPDVVLTNTVTARYLTAMGIPLLEGNDLAAFTDPGAPAQVLVNRAFVERYLGESEPVGRRLQSGGVTYIIAGVAETSRYESFDEAPAPIVYYSYRDRPLPRGEIHLRTRPGGETALAKEVQRVFRELDPLLPVFDVRTLGQHVERNLFFQRIPARMFGVLGPLILVLAAVGIHAVVTYTVAQRTAEIGVRLALGGTAGRIVRQIVGESMGVIGFGALAGWLVAFLLGRRLAPPGTLDLPILVGVPVLLMLVAAVSCWVPARRATRIDVVAALRRE